MASILYKNDSLARKLGMGVDSARSLAANHWAEGRCGSISLNVTSSFDGNISDWRSISGEYEIGQAFPKVQNNMIFITANHISMAEFVRTPMDCGSIVRLLEGGSKYDIIADNVIKISSEFIIHLNAYNRFNTQKNPPLAIVHAYPMKLEIAMRKLNFDVALFMEKAHDFSPDQVWTFKKGVEVVEYGTPEYYDNVAKALADRKLVFVPHHGIFSFGLDPIAAVDKIAAINYLAGFMI
ncbi:MAG: class II aldolase/adducin family protein [Bacteroidales bacterium]|nr:class II aldolase/adducin family protein [Bacteroidales bacterium]